MVLIGLSIPILLLISSIAKAVMDVVDFKFESSIFANIKSEKWRYWFCQDQGWKNKYKDRDPEKGPAFLGSTTVFVWVTDAWHFFQMIQLTCYDLCIAICFVIFVGISFWYIPLIVILFKIWKGLIFEAFWSEVFIK
ncbi:hypothetical protein M0P25_04335 [archaeon]|jgi:hypothetical protein|nr:hypothetical protein [archaeon]MCK9439507.1 hypothetical protein [Patescibacteria group bacterium]